MRLAPILTLWLNGPAAETKRASAYAYAILQWTAYFEAREVTPTVADVNRQLVLDFIKDRIAAGRSPETVRGDLAAMRAALRWAHQEETIAAAPFIQDVPEDMRRGPREETFTLPEIAKILETARATPERHHVFHFTMAMLAGFGRVEAVLDCDLDQQLDRRSWNLNWLKPGERQTKKRRSLMRVPPVWRPWLEEMSGKLIVYRAPRKPLEDGTEAEPYTRASQSIKTSWAKVLADAGIPHRPPNALRHTMISEMHARGVPEAQIEVASGHRGESTNKKNYRHLRPDYLKDLIDGIESVFRDLDTHTTAHLRSQRDPNVLTLADAVKKKA